MTDRFPAHDDQSQDGRYSSEQIELLLRHLPAPEKYSLESPETTLLHWGCDSGHGVQVLRQTFPQCQVTGQESSAETLAKAQESFPDCRFKLREDGQLDQRYDVVFSCRQLDQGDELLATVRQHLLFCHRFYGLLVPHAGSQLPDAEQAGLRAEDFPSQLMGFTRLMVKDLENTSQVLVLYGSTEYLAEREALQTRCEEREKWNQFYRSLNEQDPEPTTTHLLGDLSERIATLLPDGGRILEAGCGAGWQSLALARGGRYDLTLQDFSPAALTYARRLFELQHKQASFVCADAFSGGKPEYDLVFNAGVLEHYSHQEQVRLLQAMAQQSRRYVLVLVPNCRCYWYWLWRVQAASEGNWPFGKEVPAADLDSLFEAAGMQFVDQWFLGDRWTEQFFDYLPGISEELRQRIRDVHRAGIVPDSQRAYLVAGVGIKTAASLPAVGPSLFPAARHSSAGEATACLADALAAVIAGEGRQHRLQEQLQQEQCHFQEQLQQQQTRFQEQLQQEQSLVQGLQQKQTDLQQQLQTEQGRLEELQQEHHQLQEQRQQELARLGDIQYSADLALLELRSFKLSRVFRWMRWGKHFKAHVSKSRVWGIPRIAADVAARLFAKRMPVLDDPLLSLESTATLVCDTLRAVRQQTEPVTPDACNQPTESAGNSWGQLPRQCPRPVVTIVNVLFYDAEGKEYMFGGAERYVVELARCVRELGCDVELIQCGTSDWELAHPTDFGPVPVIGIKAEANALSFPVDYHRRYPQPSLVTVYSPFLLAQGMSRPRSIGISHGVAWDCHTQAVPEQRALWRQIVEGSMTACEHMVSVDTNTINWMRASSFAPLKREIKYIPNFVDTKTFHPADEGKNDDRLLVLYPRRLYAPRGFHLTVELAHSLMQNYDHVDMLFLGAADDQDARQMRALLRQYPGRVRWETRPPDEMPQAYREADIALIPTCWSEGTSLSCLEAMASGCAVVATNVGGLPELVTDGHDGRLISPEAHELIESVRELIEDSQLRKRLARNAIQTALAYDISVWRQRWKKMLAAFLRDEGHLPTPQRFLSLATPGMVYSQMTQRPQQLLKAVAQLGMESIYVSDEDDPPPMPQGSPRKLKVLARNEPLAPMDDACLYVYYCLQHCFEPNLDYLRTARFHSILFDILDDPAIQEDEEMDPERHYQASFDCLLRTATYVITSSQLLWEKYSAVRPDLRLVPNAATPEDFQADDHSPPPADLPTDRPIIAYYGSLAHWIDYDLLEAVAEAHPECRLVLLGMAASPEVQRRLDLLCAKHTNVLTLGYKPYSELKHYARFFRVGLIPFVVSQVTDAVSPVKFFEYCAAGIPVVATNFKEICQYNGPGVFVTDSRDELVQEVRAVLDADAERYADWQAAVRRIARENTWQQRAAAILDLIGYRVDGRKIEKPLSPDCAANAA